MYQMLDLDTIVKFTRDTRKGYISLGGYLRSLRIVNNKQFPLREFTEKIRKAFLLTFYVSIFATQNVKDEL